MGEVRSAYKILAENTKGRNCIGDGDKDGWIILKWSLGNRV
jgi:hypothetical protein